MKYTRVILLLAAIALLFSCHRKKIDHLKGSYRYDKNGWIYVHLEGGPHDIGYQHGYWLANEIDTTIRAVQYYLEHETKHPWSYYRQCADNFLSTHIDPEFADELIAMTIGLKAKGKNYDVIDLIAYNALEELGYYYVPQKMNERVPGSGDNKAPGNCSAFIATGSFTSDGKIVIGHNNWSPYIIGQHWNVIADIVPDSGNHMMMDCMPGFIHSGDDFVITGNGLLITETTITQFKGFDTTGTPEFVRARKAAQYSNSIDDVIKIFTTNNNGGYANDWLIGDTKTNEVAQLELGLKNYKVWRSKDTAIIGSNFARDPKLISEETTFDINDMTNSPNARKKRMEQLILVDMKGKINAETGKQIEADHYDVLQKANAGSRCVICGHIEEDGKGCAEWSVGPYYPMGAVQGKVTTADLAKDMKFWAHMGHPCGETFKGAEFYKQHPEYEWMSKYLNNMVSYPWTLFEAKK